MHLGTSIMKSFAHLLLAFFACALTATTSAAADLLLAINKGDNTLAIVDATTLKMLGTAATGPDPHEVVASSDGCLHFLGRCSASPLALPC